MKTTPNTFVITLVATITDNKIDNAVVEKIEFKSADGQSITPVTKSQEIGIDMPSTTAITPPQTEVEKARSLDYIYVDFKDGAGMQLVSINDTRLLAYFLPCYKIGMNVKPAMGARLIRSSRQVRGFRASGLALVKCDE